MESQTFIELYVLILIVLWIFLILVTLFTISRKRLEKRGYKPEYIEFIRRDTKKRNTGIALLMPVLGGIAALIVWAITGEVNGFQNLIYIVLLWMLLVIPFPVLDMRKSQKEYKELAIRTNSEVVVDFNYKVLHIIFNPPVEAIASVMVITYFIIFIEPFHVVFIHIFILWALYATARYSKYLTEPQLKDGYLYLYIFIMINQALIVFHTFREVIGRSDCKICLSDQGLLIGTILASLLFLKLIYYIFSFPRFKIKLKTH